MNTFSLCFEETVESLLTILQMKVSRLFIIDTQETTLDWDAYDTVSSCVKLTYLVLLIP